MEDYQISKDMERGQRARELLENTLLKEAFSVLETELTDVWKATKTNQAEVREEAWITLRALHRLEGILTTWVNGGKIAIAELNAKELKAERKKKST